MNLEGNINDFSLPEIIQLISMGKKTGYLHFKDRDRTGIIVFKDGLVFNAESHSEKGPLIERLVKNYKISQKQIRQAFGLKKIKKDSKVSLYDVLVEEGYMNEKDFKATIRAEILDAIFEISFWEKGEFQFEQTEVKEPDELAVAPLNLAEIEREFKRREKTWESITKKISNFDIVYVMSPEAADEDKEIKLKPLEWKILCFLDGEKTVSEIAGSFSLSEYKMGKALFGLLTAKLIKKSQVEETVAKEYFS